eukprot:maker-scaffold105_size367834-snap-gene-2.30 protein:Tk10191 transcript:maker-scaffold105_size367834-snap-gene-2.30-mRNA-1 annotation:"transposase"
MAVFDIRRRFREHGTTTRKSGQGRKRSVRTKAIIAAVQSRIKRNPVRTIRGIANSMGIAKTTIERVVKEDIGAKSRARRKKHLINQNTKAKRLARSKVLLNFMKNGPPVILYLDEKLFRVARVSNSQTDSPIEVQPWKAGLLLGTALYLSTSSLTMITSSSNRLAAECIYKEVLKLPFFHLEDVLITGFGAQNCQIPIVHSDKFKMNPTQLNEIHSDDILLHYVKSRAKNRLLKLSMFDALQDKYNHLLERMGGNERPFTIAPDVYFESSAFEEEIETKKQKLDRLRARYRRERIQNHLPVL